MNCEQQIRSEKEILGIDNFNSIFGNIPSFMKELLLKVPESYDKVNILTNFEDFKTHMKISSFNENELIHEAFVGLQFVNQIENENPTLAKHLAKTYGLIKHLDKFYLFREQVQGLSFDKFIKQHNELTDVINIINQVILIIYSMNDMKFYHHNLTCRNVIIEETKNYETYSFKVYDKLLDDFIEYKITSKYRARIVNYVYSSIVVNDQTYNYECILNQNYKNDLLSELFRFIFSTIYELKINSKLDITSKEIYFMMLVDIFNKSYNIILNKIQELKFNNFEYYESEFSNDYAFKKLKSFMLMYIDSN